ncbi:MAG: DUF86 domain-containing protein, partial [Bacteroidota bacterium]
SQIHLKPADRGDLLYLEDIDTAISRIGIYVTGMDFLSFKRDFKTVDAVIRNFEVIGEAAKNLSKDIKLRNPSVPWEEMYRLRNRVSHEYFGIDYEIIWEIIWKYLPKNKLDIERILEIERSGK